MSMKNSSEERSHRDALPRNQKKNVCFHCRKHGHFANECPDLCPPSRAYKDSNWRHSMKQRNVHESKNGNRHFNQSPAQNSIDRHNVPSDQNNIISDISVIPQPQVSTVQKEISVEHNVTILSHHNSICDNDELSHRKSYEHMDENSDSDLCDHNVRTSDILDKSDNQQINEHTDISTHDYLASSVIGSLTSDNTNDDKITNSIKPFCHDLSTQNPVRLSDAICDAHSTDDTNIGSVTPDVIAKNCGWCPSWWRHWHEFSTARCEWNAIRSISCWFLYKKIGWRHGRFDCWSSCSGFICLSVMVKILLLIKMLTQSLILIMANQLLTILMMNRMIVISITSIQMVSSIWNIKWCTSSC